MQIGGGIEVQVTARPPAVSLKDTKVSTNLTQQELETLPISRSYQDTLLLAPTGSGKTTTLYSALNELNNPCYNIITVEDPVEFQIPGINQVPVKKDGAYRVELWDTRSGKVVATTTTRSADMAALCASPGMRRGTRRSAIGRCSPPAMIRSSCAIV